MCAFPTLRARYARTGGLPYAPYVPIGARGGVEGHTPMLSSMWCNRYYIAVTLRLHRYVFLVRFRYRCHSLSRAVRPAPWSVGLRHSCTAVFDLRSCASQAHALHCLRRRPLWHLLRMSSLLLTELPPGVGLPSPSLPSSIAAIKAYLVDKQSNVWVFLSQRALSPMVRAVPVS